MNKPAARVHFIDVLRLIALAQMVNGHTLHALLREDVRQGSGYHSYLWFRGLVSVAFLLVAGLAFHVTTVARFAEHKRDPQAMRRRVLRALQIIAIGLFLRLPLTPLLELNARGFAAGLLDLSHVDVLPCIGVSLLMLEGLVALSRRPWQVVSACFGLAVLCALAAPWGASLPAAGPIAFVTGWLGPQGGSAFPLLPFSGYVFAGVVLGALALPAHARGANPALRLMAAWLGLFSVASLAQHSAWSLTRAVAANVHSPTFFTQKLAAVTLAVAVLAYALRNVRALPEALRILTGETLAIYVFHLIVLYGFPIFLQRRLGGAHLPLSAALSVSACMLVASTALGLGWHRLKRWTPARRFIPSPRVTVLASCAVAACALLLVASQAFADPPVNTNGGRYAISGYDPVAYFDVGKPVPGVVAFQTKYRGATWLFSSAAHLHSFEADPTHFMPSYSGYCAYAAAQGRQVSIDPQAWAIVNGRLFLNYSLDVRVKWNADRERYIREADAHFPK
jgi:YHS domain-containing protein